MNNPDYLLEFLKNHKQGIKDLLKNTSLAIKMKCDLCNCVIFNVNEVCPLCHGYRFEEIGENNEFVFAREE